MEQEQSYVYEYGRHATPLAWEPRQAALSFVVALSVAVAGRAQILPQGRIESAGRSLRSLPGSAPVSLHRVSGPPAPVPLVWKE